jgi:hypothetical protein
MRDLVLLVPELPLKVPADSLRQGIRIASRFELKSVVAIVKPQQAVHPVPRGLPNPQRAGFPRDPLRSTSGRWACRLDRSTIADPRS